MREKKKGIGYHEDIEAQDPEQISSFDRVQPMLEGKERNTDGGD